MPNFGNAWMPVVPQLDMPGLRRLSSQVSRELGSTGDKAGREAGERYGKGLASGVSGHVAKIGASMAGAFAGGAAVSGLKGVVEAASEAEQQVGAVQAVFKNSAGTIEASANSAARGLGISAKSYNEMAATLGAGLKNKGIKDYAAQTQNLIKIGADLSAQYGGSTKEAVEALGSLMRGETDPIERYGVAINEDALKAEALATGLLKPIKNTEQLRIAQINAAKASHEYSAAVKKHGKNSDEAQTAEARMLGTQARLAKVMEGRVPQMDAETKAKATLSLVTKQTADAQGAFNRESDTYAHKTQVLNAQLDDYKAKLGAYVLPYATKFAGLLVDKAVPAVVSFAREMKNGSGAGGEVAGALKDIYNAAVPVVSFLVDHKEAVAAGVAAFAVAKATVGSVNALKKSYDDVKSAASAAKGAAQAFKQGLDAGAKVGSGGQVETFGEAMKAAGAKARTAAVDVGKFTAAKARATATAAVDGIKSIGSSLASAGAAARTAAVDLGSAAAAHARAGAAAALSATRTLAARAAQLASAAAAKAMAAGQWLVNAALSANPIGLVIAGLVALGAGLVVAYQKSETFRKVVDAAWAGIKSAAASAVTWFQTTAWPVMQGVFQSIGDKASGLWNSYIKPAFANVLSAARTTFLWLRDSAWPAVRDAFGWVAGKASWLWTNGLKPHLDNILAAAKVTFLWLRDHAWPVVRDAFGWIADKSSWLWNSGVKPHFDAMKRGVSAVSDAFSAAKSAIGRTWSGLTSAVSGPISSALSWIKSNFVDKLAGLLDAVGLGSLASKLRGTSLSPAPPQNTRQILTSGRRASSNRGAGMGYATGGVLPGYTPGKDVHHFWSPTAGGLHLSGGEAIMRPEWTRAVGGPAAVARMNAAARRGQAFASGGVWQAESQWIKQHFPDLVITSTTGGGHAAGSYHYRGQAVDVGGPLGRLQAAARAIMHQFGSNIAELILNPGASVKNGRQVDPSMWGAATWANHGGSNLHLHWAMNNMAGGSGIAGFIGGLFSSLKEKAISGLRGAIGGLPIPGMFGEITKSVLGKALTSIVGLADSEAVAADAGSGLSAAPVGQGVQRWSSVAGEALKMAGLPASLLPLFLQRIQVESSGNPRAINLTDSNARRGTPSIGLAQVIQPTFDAYAGPLRSRGIYDPLANLYASAMYTKSRYGVSGIRSAWSGTKGYAVGTPSAAPGLAWVGERGPELVDFRGGERVYTHEQSRRLVERPAQQVTYVVNATPQRADDIVRAAQEAEYRRRVVHAIY